MESISAVRVCLLSVNCKVLLCLSESLDVSECNVQPLIHTAQAMARRALRLVAVWAAVSLIAGPPVALCEGGEGAVQKAAAAKVCIWKSLMGHVAEGRPHNLYGGNACRGTKAPFFREGGRSHTFYRWAESARGRLLPALAAGVGCGISSCWASVVSTSESILCEHFPTAAMPPLTPTQPQHAPYALMPAVPRPLSSPPPRRPSPQSRPCRRQRTLTGSTRSSSQTQPGRRSSRRDVRGSQRYMPQSLAASAVSTFLCCFLLAPRAKKPNLSTINCTHPCSHPAAPPLPPPAPWREKTIAGQIDKMLEKEFRSEGRAFASLTPSLPSIEHFFRSMPRRFHTSCVPADTTA